ncbi:hypothetical protein ACVDFE_07865 [Lentzea chajnantorensis]
MRGGKLMGDHWVSNSPTIMRSTEQRTQTVRCLGCWGLFSRAPGATTSCPKPGCEGASCTTNLYSARRPQA